MLASWPEKQIADGEQEIARLLFEDNGKEEIIGKTNKALVL